MSFWVFSESLITGDWRIYANRCKQQAFFVFFLFFVCFLANYKNIYEKSMPHASSLSATLSLSSHSSNFSDISHSLWYNPLKLQTYLMWKFVESVGRGQKCRVKIVRIFRFDEGAGPVLPNALGTVGGGRRGKGTAWNPFGSKFPVRLKRCAWTRWGHKRKKNKEKKQR